MSDDAAVLHRAARPRRRSALRDDGEALVEVAEARALPRRARRLDAGRRRLAAADARGAPAAGRARRRRAPAARRRRRPRALAADVPELRLPARGAPASTPRAAVRAVPAPRARVRAVRRVRRHRAPCGSRRAAAEAPVWDLARDPAHGPSGIAIGWCMTPRSAPAAPSRVPAEALEEAHVRQLDLRDHPRARRARRPSRRRSARAARRACRTRALGQHREPVALPEPAARAGTAARRRRPRRRPGRRRAACPARVVPLVAVVAREQPPAARRTPRRRTAKCAASSAASAASRHERRASRGSRRGDRPHPGPVSRWSTRSHADRPEHAWQRAQPAFASRWSSPASAIIAETSRVDAARRSPGSGAGASAISVPGTGRSGTTNG